MQPRIETIPEKKLIGKRLTMTFAADRTGELWRSFMPERKEIPHPVSTDLYALQEYGTPFDFFPFNPDTLFEKWAAMEVADFAIIPAGMEAYTLAGGLYAVFLHRGAAHTGEKTFRYILETWLPGSAYTLDHRAHFEVLGAKYKNGDPDSEEEIWIPIKRKA